MSMEQGVARPFSPVNNTYFINTDPMATVCDTIHMVENRVSGGEESVTRPDGSAGNWG